MTKTIEELKPKMYLSLSDAKLWSGTIQSAETTLDVFETRLEAYLEALRQELQTCREDRDGAIILKTEFQNRLQAFQFANQSAGEFLQQARAKIKAQRQSIGQLKNERDNARFTEKVRNTQLQKARQELSELRKLAGSTSGQSSGESASCIKCGGSGRVVAGILWGVSEPITLKCDCQGDFK